MKIRNGIGFDVHRLKEGRKLVLGGVEIENTMGLDGHSDADVLCHAVCDALLGAVAAGDIGTHFPNTDPRWKDADSLELLAAVGKKVNDMSYKIVNIDVTVIAEAPVLSPRIPAMRKNIAGKLGVPTEDVSVKATTAEKMGALGREEGIAALAVATVEGDDR